MGHYYHFYGIEDPAREEGCFFTCITCTIGIILSLLALSAAGGIIFLMYRGLMTLI